MHDAGRALALTMPDRAICLAQNDRIFLKNMVEAVCVHHPLDVIGDKEHTDLLWVISYYAAVDKVKGRK